MPLSLNRILMLRLGHVPKQKGSWLWKFGSCLDLRALILDPSYRRGFNHACQLCFSCCAQLIRVWHREACSLEPSCYTQLRGTIQGGGQGEEQDNQFVLENRPCPAPLNDPKVSSLPGSPNCPKQQTLYSLYSYALCFGILRGPGTLQ